MFNYYNNNNHISKEESNKYLLSLARRYRINDTINKVIQNKNTIDYIYVGMTNKTYVDIDDVKLNMMMPVADIVTYRNIYTTTSKNIAKQSFDFLTSKLIDYYGNKCLNMVINYQIPQCNLKKYKVFIMYKNAY